MHGTGFGVGVEHVQGKGSGVDHKAKWDHTC